MIGRHLYKARSLEGYWLNSSKMPFEDTPSSNMFKTTWYCQLWMIFEHTKIQLKTKNNHKHPKKSHRSLTPPARPRLLIWLALGKTWRRQTWSWLPTGWRAEDWDIFGLSPWVSYGWVKTDPGGSLGMDPAISLLKV